MDQFIDIHAPPLNFKMTLLQSCAVVTAITQLVNIDGDLDFIDVARKLEGLNLITRQERNTFLTRMEGIEKKFYYLFQLIRIKVTFYELINVFKVIGLNKLVEEILKNHFRVGEFDVGKAEVPNTDFDNSHYLYLKLCLDNSVFRNGPLNLELNIDQQTAKLVHGCPIKDLQTALDKKIAYCVLRFQQTTSSEQRKHLLGNMIAIIPDGADTRSLWIIYHGKMAITAARENDRPTAESHIREALTKMELCPACFATISTFHDILYVHRNLFNQNVCNRNLEEVLEWGHRALLTLANQAINVQILWKRIFLQYMFLSLLRINAYFQMIDSQEIEERDIHMAETAIEESDRISEGIPSRRKMILFLAKARLHELKRDMNLAVLYAKQAFSETANGSYFNYEVDNIRNYIHRLQTKRCSMWGKVIWQMSFLKFVCAFLVIMLFDSNALLCCLFVWAAARFGIV